MKKSQIIIGIDATNIRSGGTMRHLIEILANLDIEDHQVKKVVIWSYSSLLSKINNHQWLKKISRPEFELGYLRRAIWQKFQLAKEATRENCDVLFIPGGAYDTNFRPIVTMSQNLMPFEFNQFKINKLGIFAKMYALRMVQIFGFRNADACIFLTKYSKQTIEKFTGSLKGSVAVISHGVRDEFRRDPLHVEYKGLDEVINILYVSDFYSYKQHLEVIAAVSKLKTEGLKLSLYLIGGPGDGDYHRKVLQKISECDPSKNYIFMVGHVPNENLPDWYSYADIFLFASTCENLPITLMEAMAAGLPIASSKTLPMPEILGDACVYFDARNSEDIASTIKSLVYDPALRKKLAFRAFSSPRISSWKKCSDQTISFICSIARGEKLTDD